MKESFSLKVLFKKKFLLYLSFTLISTFFLVGCSQNQGDNPGDNLEAMEAKIYYLDTSETSIVGMDYLPKGDTIEELINEFIELLSENPESSSMKKGKPDSVLIQGYELTEDGRLTLEFNSEYNNMSGIVEILCRATIVKTLAQIEGVNYIEFTVGGQPLMDSTGKPIGFMEESNFIHSTNAENVYITVYFSNVEGNALLPSNLKITYDGNIPIVELILNRLISGPIEDNMLQTIPEGTKLINVTTKDNIAYVDFSEEFLNINPQIEGNVVIYSVVNSLIELSYINKVQFTINGAIVEDYNGIPLNNIFERKLELIAGCR